MSAYRDQLEVWLKGIDVVADRVLDVGGSANPVAGRVAHWNVSDYFILDNGCEQSFHTIWRTPEFVQDICQPWSTWKDGIKSETFEAFDIVFCLEVAEYWTDPVAAIQNLANLVKPGGTLYVSFPAIYPVHEPEESDMMRFTRRYIDYLLSLEPFSYTVTPRVATAGKSVLSDFYRLEGMHPVKNSDVVFDIGYMCTATKS